MSYDAIYQVTSALRQLLHSQLKQSNSDVKVTLLLPGDTLPEEPGVNLYLYRVTESPFTKNQSWPGDRVTPPLNKPVIGLQLSYLLTPLGPRPADANFEEGDHAHTMLGIAMLTLQENPILNDIHLPDFDSDTALAKAPSLLNSYEQIKIRLVPTSLEELSKIWATINKPYRLSVAYEVSLIELTSTTPPPVGGGIVTSTGVSVVPLTPPRLTALTPTGGALVRIVNNTITPNDLQISGFGFSFPGQNPIVRVGGQPVVIKSSPTPTDQSLTVVLPLDLDAGPQADVHVTLNGRTSTPLQFRVSPWLANLTPIRTDLDGTPKLALKGSGFTPPPQAVRFDAPGTSTKVTAFDVGGSDTQTTVAIPKDLANGIYNVRVVLSDAASSASNSRTLEVIPYVNSTIGVVVIDAPDTPHQPVHQLTLTGERLKGNDVRLVIDGVSYQAGANQDSKHLVYTLKRVLSQGSYNLVVNVDGHVSHSIRLEV